MVTIPLFNLSNHNFQLFINDLTVFLRESPGRYKIKIFKLTDYDDFNSYFVDVILQKKKK